MKENVNKHRKMLKLWRFGIVALTLVLLSVLAYGWWDSSKWEVKSDVEHSKLDADMAMEGVRYTEIRKGQKFWELHAKGAKFFASKREAVLTDAEATIYMRGGRKVFVKSNRAIIHVNSQDIDLFDNVTIETGPYVLVTDSIHYYNNTRIIETKDRVVLRGNGMVLKGHGFTLNAKTRKLNVLSSVDCLLSGKAIAGVG